MSHATLSIVVQTMADDYDRLGTLPTAQPTQALVMILPHPGCHGWWSFRMAAATYTAAPVPTFADALAALAPAGAA